MGAPRDPYAAVGEGMRELQRRAAAAHQESALAPLEWQTLLAVLAAIASWSRLSDWSSARQLAALTYARSLDTVTGGQRRRTHDALAGLIGRNVLPPTVMPRGGPHAGFLLSLPASNVSHMEHVGNVSPREHVGTDQRAPLTITTCSADDANVSRPRGNTEEISEDLPEAGTPEEAAERVRAIRDLAGLLRDSDRFHGVRPLPEDDVVETVGTVEGDPDDDDLVEVEEADDELLEKWRRAVRELDDQAA